MMHDAAAAADLTETDVRTESESLRRPDRTGAVDAADDSASIDLDGRNDVRTCRLLPAP